jgi:hypothetical protein
MEVVRDGQVVQQSRRVSFEAGQRVSAVFEVPSVAATALVN